MIAVDSSALFAVLQGEDEADACKLALGEAVHLLIAAPTLTEALIVAASRGLSAELGKLIAGLDLTVIPLTEPRARAAAEAYCRWGKGFHPAALNLCDSFAYVLAKENDCPLLFVGRDFAGTDIEAAITH